MKKAQHKKVLLVGADHLGSTPKKLYENGIRISFIGTGAITLHKIERYLKAST